MDDAEYYINRIYGRLERLARGESIGSMIASEYEGLETDSDFELIRH
jgi:hypothetical protein